jgi:hypothetical protein
MKIEYPLLLLPPKKRTFAEYRDYRPTEKDFRNFEVTLPKENTPHILKGLKVVTRTSSNEQSTCYELDDEAAASVATLYNQKEETRKLPVDLVDLY